MKLLLLELVEPWVELVAVAEGAGAPAANAVEFRAAAAVAAAACWA